MQLKYSCKFYAYRGNVVGKKEKLLEEFKRANTFKYKDFVALMKYLGYEKKERGGSAVAFYNKDISVGSIIYIHRPHPENEIKAGPIKSVLETLKEAGII